MRALLCVAALAFSLRSRGQDFTYRFDWHGFSNLFHASFTVSQQDFSSQFQGPLFWNTLSITNPGGREYRANMEGTQIAAGHIDPGWSLYVNLIDYHDNTEIVAVGGYVLGVPYSTAGAIEQIGTDYGGITEQGYWSVVQQIPEPSIAALMIVGAAVAFRCRRRGTMSKPVPRTNSAPVLGSGTC